jgi:hypothetical protein
MTTPALMITGMQDSFRIMRGDAAAIGGGEQQQDPDPVVLSPVPQPEGASGSTGNVSDVHFALPPGPLHRCTLQVHPYAPRSGNGGREAGGRAHRDRSAPGKPLHVVGRWRWVPAEGGAPALVDQRRSEQPPRPRAWTSFACSAQEAGHPCTAPLSFDPVPAGPRARLLQVRLDGRPPRLPVLVCSGSA